MEFATFAERAAAIEAEPADLAIEAHVTDLLSDAGEDVETVARFVQGRAFPAWRSTTLDVGPNACYEAIARAAGTNVGVDDVEDRLATIGEIGDVAASYEFGGQHGLAAFADDGCHGGDDLSVREVYESLADVAAAAGSGSRDRKGDLLFGLFNRCSSDEARYLARLVLSEMRIGVGEGTVRDAIAAAFDVPKSRVERALQVSNDYGRVARVARDGGLAGLDAMDLEVGRPVQPMLAQVGSVTDALDAWAEAAVEWKYDGARIQVHHDPTPDEHRDSTPDEHRDRTSTDHHDRTSTDHHDRTSDGRRDRTSDRDPLTGEDDSAPETRVFSRNMEEVTDALPEVVEFARGHLDEAVILDGEVVAIDDGDLLPFQAVLRRFRRKHDVAKTREDVTVRPVFFDCLHADGTDLLDEPLTTRHARLESVLADRPEASPGTIPGFSLLALTDDPDEIEAIDAEALEAGHEGIMLKDPDAAYSPGRRGKHWRKRKPDVETIDCVVTGAEWGEGRRATFLGTFELSVRDGDSLTTIGKVATGITDEKLAELTDLLEPHAISQEGQRVDLEPAVVFEVGYEEIQTSPTYGSGYALRFPRFVGVRHDRDPSDADTLERVESVRSR